MARVRLHDLPKRCATFWAIGIALFVLFKGIDMLIPRAFAAVEDGTVFVEKIQGKDTWVFEVTYTGGNRVRYEFRGPRGQGKPPTVTVNVDTGSGYETHGDYIRFIPYFLEVSGNATPWNEYNSLSMITTGDDVNDGWNMVNTGSGITLTAAMELADPQLGMTDAAQIQWVFSTESPAIGPTITYDLTNNNPESASYSGEQVAELFMSDVPGNSPPPSFSIPYCGEHMISGMNAAFTFHGSGASLSYDQSWTTSALRFDLSDLPEAELLGFSDVILGMQALLCD